MDQIEAVASWLVTARRGIVFTGAGISTESGIPDFRGPNGFWKRNDASKYTFQNYVADPEHRKERWRQAVEGSSFMRSGDNRPSPNAAHVAVARLEQLGMIRGVITQNVDELHQDAGTREILELHGTARKISCLSCGETWPNDIVLQRVRDGEEDPQCTSCGGILKSATISFGQQLSPEVIDEAHRWSLQADFFLVIGSSLVVYPAAALPGVAKKSGARLAIVNNEPTDQDDIFDAVIAASAGDTLSAIVDRIERIRSN